MKFADGYRLQVLAAPEVLVDKVLRDRNFRCSIRLGSQFPEMLDYVPGTVTALIRPRASEVTDIVLFADQPKKVSVDKALMLQAAVISLRLSLEGLPVTEVPVYEYAPSRWECLQDSFARQDEVMQQWVAKTIAPPLAWVLDKLNRGVRTYGATTLEQVRSFGYLRRR